MKHLILAKFKENIDYKSYLEDIKNIFNETLKIDGIHSVDIKISCSDRKNRYHILIEIDMEKEALEIYDVCAAHILWKEKYGKMLETKAIFDYE